MTGQEVVRLNESALASVLADVSFIETEIKRLGKSELDHVFDEVKHVCQSFSTSIALQRLILYPQTINIILSDAVQAYMEPSIRSMSYPSVKPLSLAMILAKLSKAASSQGGQANMFKAARRRGEADEVARLAGK